MLSISFSHFCSQFFNDTLQCKPSNFCSTFPYPSVYPTSHLSRLPLEGQSPFMNRQQQLGSKQELPLPSAIKKQFRKAIKSTVSACPYVLHAGLAEVKPHFSSPRAPVTSGLWAILLLLLLPGGQGPVGLCWM